MPVDKKVAARHRRLDRLFRSKEGLSYLQIKERLAEGGIDVTVRTIQKDIEVFHEEYGAQFSEYYSGHSKLIRYQDITKSVLDKSDLAEQLLQVSRQIDSESSLYPPFILASNIINHIAAGNDVKEFYDAVDFGENIDLENIDFFGPILNAIINRRCISFEYKPFTKEEAEKVTVSPYLLKQYNQRWFLICKTVGTDHLWIDALDRIASEPEAADEKYEQLVRGALDGLDDVIGTTYAFNDEIQAEDITLRVVSAERFNYIKTKPLHRSQNNPEKVDEDGTAIITLHVKVNPELIAAILSFGSDVEVLSPDTLREQINLEINNMLSQHSNSTK